MDTPTPKLTRFEAAHSVRSRLAEMGYSERGLAGRLGRNALGLPRFFESRWRERHPAPAPLDPLIGLLLMGEETELSELEGALEPEHIRALEEMRVIEVRGSAAKSHLKLFPCQGLLIATDNEVPSPHLNRVMCLYPDSYVLANIIDRPRVHQVLDLCTGSGIYALRAASHADRVLGVDISDRAIAFSQFNAGLNQIRNAEFRLGDLYGPVEGATFDIIIANAPFNPEPETPAGAHAPSPEGADYFSGGRSGEELLSRVIAGLDSHLSPNGVCHLVTLLVHPKQGSEYRERISNWLGGRLSDFDVLIWATPYDHFEKVNDPAKAAFLREHFERFEFGTISIRRRAGREPIYYHGPPPRALHPLFDEDGNIKIRIDDQAFMSYAPATPD
jgi:methylase of polypeptide subunit release factors